MNLTHTAQKMGKKEGGPQSVVDKVLEVIRVQKSPGGSSRQALVKGMKEHFPEVEAAQLKAALKKGVTAKVLEQNGQRFWEAGVPPPPPPAEETVDIVEVQVGSGEEASSGCECTMSYKGTLKEDGSTFDQAKKFKFCLGAGEVIKGWEVGVKGMRVGGERKLTVPSKLGYGARGSPPEIPPNAVLIFDIKLLDVK